MKFHVSLFQNLCPSPFALPMSMAEMGLDPSSFPSIRSSCAWVRSVLSLLFCAEQSQLSQPLHMKDASVPLIIFIVLCWAHSSTSRSLSYILVSPQCWAEGRDLLAKLSLRQPRRLVLFLGQLSVCQRTGEARSFCSNYF